MLILQGRTFAEDIDEALDNIHDRLASMGLTGNPRVWMAPVQCLKDMTWFEYICECGGIDLEWIKVSERLPEIWTPVIVYTRDGHVTTASLEKNLTNKLSWGFECASCELGGVLYWMPYPDPPKED